MIEKIDSSKLIFLTYESPTLQGFRRRALRTKNEILAYLIGEVWNDKKGGMKCAHIYELYYPELAVSNPDEVRPSECAPRGSIGTIHSHPEIGTLGPSLDDIHSAILEGEKIYGIYSYFTREKGQRTIARTQWFSPNRVVVVN